MKMKLLVEGTLIISPDEDAVKGARKASYLVIIEGDSISLAITPGRRGTIPSPQESGLTEASQASESVQGEVVLDQMFKGFPETLERELQRNAHVDEIRGKGLDSLV